MFVAIRFCDRRCAHGILQPLVVLLSGNYAKIFQNYQAANEIFALRSNSLFHVDLSRSKHDLLPGTRERPTR